MAALPEEDPPPSAPDWLVTFSDLVSLLVTLFIMMLTFTTSETDDLVKVLDVLKGSFGLHQVKNKPEVVEQQHMANQTRRGISSPDLVKPEHKDPRVHELMSDYLTAADFDQGVSLTPEIPNGFGRGSDKPSLALTKEIRRLAIKLKVHPKRRYMVIGHCDPQSDDPASDPEAHFKSMDLLGLSRARRVARIMGLAGVQLIKVHISSQGARQPREHGYSAVEQDRNRRVQIVIFMSETDSQGMGK